jgi:hypothetical protein
MHNGVAVDMVLSVYPRWNAPGNGRQGMTVNGVNISFSYDGVQLFVQHHLCMAPELATMKPLVLTSTKQWHPWHDLMHCLCSSNPAPKVIVVCCQSVSKDAIEKWQCNLGFAPHNAVLKT